MTTVEGAVDDTTTSARSAPAGSRIRSWLDEPRLSVASMSSGQRYTAVLALALAVAMVTIGVPKERSADTGSFGATAESVVTYEPGPAPPTTMAPAAPAAPVSSFAAEPPAFVEPATTTTMAPAPAETPAPPPSEPPPSSTTTTTAPPASPLPMPVPVP